MSQNKKEAPKRVFRKLEELNLIDNFLFQQMLSQEEDGEEFARILLSTILGRSIRKVKITPQKNILGIDTDKHGIRLDAYIEDVSDEVIPDLADAEIIPDIYDIEPNNSYEKESLPKRVRYYHGLIDTQLLSAGVNYSKLPNMVIIIILPYDPFDKNRMVYTIQNHCMEDGTIPYNDGAKKIFLYTKGTEGNPSQELKDMLKYIEKSTDDNVANKDIASIQKLVKKVKCKKEVGVNYMKSWEVEEMIKKEAYDAGVKDGYDSGYGSGYDSGYGSGYDSGYGSGYDSGYDSGVEVVDRLNILLSEAGRTDDIIKAAKDKEYQKQLLEEFCL